MEGYGGPAQPSPTIAQCLNGGYLTPVDAPRWLLSAIALLDGQIASIRLAKSVGLLHRCRSPSLVQLSLNRLESEAIQCNCGNIRAPQSPATSHRRQLHRHRRIRRLYHPNTAMYSVKVRCVAKLECCARSPVLINWNRNRNEKEEIS
jgi:hypothetical protein